MLRPRGYQTPLVFVATGNNGRAERLLAVTHIACELGSLSDHSFSPCIDLGTTLLVLISVIPLSLSILDSVSTGEVMATRKNTLYLS